ncbi:MAG TPA: glycosyltransferase [Chloroflexota bacterium]
MAPDSGVPAELQGIRVAIVHDYLNQPGGAEKVVETLCEMFPDAPVFTSVYDPDRMPAFWRGRDIRTSFMQRISPRLSLAKALVPLYPTAFEMFDFRGYDLVLSSTTAFAKGIITRPETCHVCYCNNPTRFLWMYHDYFEYERYPGFMRAAFPWLATAMRGWDYTAAQRVDFFIAGSYNAARRIAKYYRRTSDVVQPPIDAQFFHPSVPAAEYFLVVSRLQPYKRIDLAIEACNRLRLPLRIVGKGPDRPRLERLAGPTVQFLGSVSDEEVRDQMSGCRALLFPGEEDFGLTPLEVQACGRPVIAFRAGGALETILDGVSGTFFSDQTVDSLCGVLENFQDSFKGEVIRAHALRFDREEFKRRLFGVLLQRYSEHVQNLNALSRDPGLDS